MDYTQFSDKELTEALNFHRRQRNMSRGINEAAHARQTQMVRMLEAEEARRLDEAVKVDKKNYSWGKMITVHHGSSHSFPLHPEHQEKIKNLKDGESTAFKDETGSHVTASREGDKVHLKLRGANQKTTVAHSHFTEAIDYSKEKPNKYVIYKHKDKYGVSQDVGTGYNWDHSYHHGYHDTVDSAKAWAAKHAGKYPHKIEVKEEVELDEAAAAKPTYHYYVTKNDIGPGKKKLTHSKKKPFATERDAFEHILKSGGRQSGIIHKVHVETGKIVQNRGVDSGQSGYASSVSGDDPLHTRDLKEDISLEKSKQIDEISQRVKDEYIKKADIDYNKSFKSGDYARMKKRERGLAIATKDYNEEVQLDELSKKTLSSYVKKASADQYFKGQDVQYHDNKARNAEGPFAKETKKKHYALAAKANEKASNRDTGIGRAIDRLTKEEVELEENIGGMFKDASEWERSAKARGLVVKPATHPSDEMTKYQIAKDKEGNNRGHFDHGTKSGHLKEEVQLDEETIPSNVAARLADRHFTAAFHHKKNGNIKGYAAHLKVANRIEDAVIRAGSHMPIRSTQIEKASDKAFSEHPHKAAKPEYK